jgi:hypothetical protein
MQVLNFPEFKAVFKTLGQKKYIFDNFRKKFVTLTPEEWVRQHVAHFLCSHQSVPIGLISLEVPMKFHSMNKRADIVVYNRNHQPGLLVECKAPDVSLKQETFQQIATYNFVLNASLLLVTNGIETYLFHIDFQNSNMNQLEKLPEFNQW